MHNCRAPILLMQVEGGLLADAALARLLLGHTPDDGVWVADKGVPDGSGNLKGGGDGVAPP